MFRRTALAIAVLTLAGPAEGAWWKQDLGDRLLRTFPNYVALPSMPLTMLEAVTAGWLPEGACEEGRGIPFKIPGDEETTLFFTPVGQVSGIAIDVFGEAPSEEVVEGGFYEKIADGHYRMTVAFRKPAGICSQRCLSKVVLGDRLVVNPQSIGYHLPLTAARAERNGFVKGSCTITMGTHYLKNLVENSTVAETIMPLVPMYNTDGDIHGIRFHSFDRQFTSRADTNNWDPNLSSLCTNTCDERCTEEHVEWTTYHVMFKELWTKTGPCSATCNVTCC